MDSKQWETLLKEGKTLMERFDVSGDLEQAEDKSFIKKQIAKVKKDFMDQLSKMGGGKIEGKAYISYDGELDTAEVDYKLKNGDKVQIDVNSHHGDYAMTINGKSKELDVEPRDIAKEYKKRKKNM